MRTCNNCGHPLDDDLRFCTQCGNLVASEEKPQPRALTTRLASVDRETIITAAGLLGLIIIILAVVSLLEPIIQQINLEQVSYILLAIGILLLVMGLLLIILERLNNISKVLITTTGEILVLAVVYLFDIAYRSELTRYTILSLIIVLTLVGLYMPQVRPLGLFGSVWQLASVYLGFVSLISFGGSSYYSRLVFSVALLLVILSSHQSIFRSKSTLLLFWTIPLEFFTLLQTDVANSTHLFVTSVVVIASLPLLLYLYQHDLPKISVKGQNLFELALLLPQIALVFVLSNGGLQAPLPEVLTSLFIFIWMGYAYLIREHKPQVSTSESRLSISTILIIALLGFTLSEQILTSLVLLSIVFLLPLLVTPDLRSLPQRMLPSSVAVLASLSYLYWIRVDRFLLYVVASVTLLAHLGLAYYRYREDVMSLSVYYQLSVSVLTCFFLLIRLDFLLLLPLNLIVHLMFMELTKLPPRFGALLIAFPAISAILLAKSVTYQWLIIGTQLTAIAYLVLRQPTDDRILGLSILLLPLVFVLTQAQSNILVNVVLAIFVLASIYFLLQPAITDTQLLGSLFLLASVVLRDVAPAEAGSLQGMDVKFLVMMVLVTLFTVFYLLSNFLLSSPRFSVVAHLSWFGAVLYTLSFLHRNLYEQLSYVVYFGVMSIMTLELLSIRVRSRYPQVQLVLSLFLFLLPVFFSVFPLYYLSWVVLGVVQLLDIFGRPSPESSLPYAGYALVAVFNLIALMTVSSWFAAVSLLVFLAFLALPNQLNTLLHNLELDTRFEISLVVFFSFVLSLVNGILRNVSIFSVLQSMLFYGLSTLLLIVWLIRLRIRGLNAMMAVYFSFSGLFLLQITYQPMVITLITVLSSAAVLYLEPAIREKPQQSLFDGLNSIVLSVAAVLLVVMIDAGLYLINEGILGFQEYNQWLVGLALASIVISLLLEQRGMRTNLTFSLIVTGGLTFVITTFFGFYEVVISNLLFSLTAVITASLGVYFRKQDVFGIGIGLSVLSAFKAVLDLLTLDSFTRSLSLLMVGIQLIFYVIVWSNLPEDYFTQLNSDTGEPEK